MINKRAQGLADYAIIIAVVAVALVTMQTYFKRSIQGVVKASIDKLGGFDSGISPEVIQRMSDEREIDPEYGALKAYNTDNSLEQKIVTTTKTGGVRESNINTDKITVKDKEPKVFYQELREDTK